MWLYLEVASAQGVGKGVISPAESVDSTLGSGAQGFVHLGVRLAGHEPGGQGYIEVRGAGAAARPHPST